MAYGEFDECTGSLCRPKLLGDLKGLVCRGSPTHFKTPKSQELQDYRLAYIKISSSFITK